MIYLRTAAKKLQELTANWIVGRISLRLVVAVLTFTVGVTFAAVWMTRHVPKLEDPIGTRTPCFPGLGQKTETLKAAEGGYFPEKTFYQDEDRNRFINNWYTRYLIQMTEPSLLISAKEDVTYRFLWLRSFHSTVVVRLWSEGERQMVSVKELSRKTETQSSQLLVDQTRSLKKEEWAAFMKLIDEACFWEVPVTSDGPIAMDGAWWVLEGADRGFYHVAIRQTPDSGSYRELCIYMLKLSGLPLDASKGEIY